MKYNNWKYEYGIDFLNSKYCSVQKHNNKIKCQVYLFI